MNLLFLSSEVAPFAKTGGLGDVAAALPRALHRRGHDVRVFMPLYSRVDVKKTHLRRLESIPTLRITLGARTYDCTLFAATLPGSSLEIFLVHCPALYARHALYSHDPDEHLRFQVFNCAALEAAQRMRFAPDIIHVNDWQTALVPLLLKTRFAWDRAIFGRAKTVLTIHNLNYQGVFPSAVGGETGIPAEAAHLVHQDQLREGRINFLLHGILYANAITTVSPTYAAEIRTPEYGAGLEWALRERGPAVVGILNGVDYGIWSPEVDSHLPFRYSAQDLAGKARCKQALLAKARLPHLPGVPLFGIVSRLAAQKGFTLVEHVLPGLLQRERFQLIVTGTGERHTERMFRQLQAQFPTQVHFHNAFDNDLAHQIEAASDFFLMPSRYEPCGLNQMYSLKYGAVPIVRKTGGLADTVEQWSPRTGRGTGIVFDAFDAPALRWAMQTALSVYRDRAAYARLQQNAMAQDFSWEHQVLEYEQLYSRLHG